jgi:Tfp pilus assembly protein PilO
MFNSAVKFNRGSWLVTIPMVAIAVVQITFVYLPGRRAVTQLRKDIEYKERIIKDASHISATLSAAQQDLISVKSYISNWRQVASTTHHLPAVYGSIHNLSKQSGTTPTRFEPQVFTDLSLLRQVPINMSFTGTLSQIHEFVRSMEGLPLTIWIESLRLDKDRQTGSNVLCEVKMIVFSDNTNISNYADSNK